MKPTKADLASQVDQPRTLRASLGLITLLACILFGIGGLLIHRKLVYVAWAVLAFVTFKLIEVILTALFPAPAPPPVKFSVGDITLESLRFYSGYDYMRPILLAIRGQVYDVTTSSDLYAPGKKLHVYAGKEISRALAKESQNEDDCCDTLADLNDAEMQRLDEQVAEYRQRYDVVGQVVPPKVLTLPELAKYDGTDPTKPLYLSIQGTVYDITKGKQFYGPDGIYPFAGKEVARAFALYSTDLADCNDNLEGLSYTEKENLRDWVAKFQFKYPVIGTIGKEGPAAST